MNTSKLKVADGFCSECKRRGFTEQQIAAMYARAESESITSAESFERALARVLVSEMAKNAIRDKIIRPLIGDEFLVTIRPRSMPVKRANAAQSARNQFETRWRR